MHVVYLKTALVNLDDEFIWYVCMSRPCNHLNNRLGWRRSVISSWPECRMHHFDRWFELKLRGWYIHDYHFKEWMFHGIPHFKEWITVAYTVACYLTDGMALDKDVNKKTFKDVIEIPLCLRVLRLNILLLMTIGKVKNISIYLWYSIQDTFNHSLSLFLSKTPPLALVSFISISSIVWLAV